MALSAVHEEVITFSFGTITAEFIQQFVDATGSTHHAHSPLTLPTIFRKPEFAWLDRLQIDLHELLHTEQEYEFVRTLREGDSPELATRMADYRSRRGLLFVTLETDVTSFGQPILKVRSSFVVRRDSDWAPPEKNKCRKIRD